MQTIHANRTMCVRREWIMKRKSCFAGGSGIGIVNGLLGGGGGMLAVPVLRKIGLAERDAHGDGDRRHTARLHCQRRRLFLKRNGFPSGSSCPWRSAYGWRRFGSETSERPAAESHYVSVRRTHADGRREDAAVMSFYLLLLCGFLGGIFGGMGMGGGTAAHTPFNDCLRRRTACGAGVESAVFRADGGFALALHAKSGLRGRRGFFG